MTIGAEIKIESKNKRKPCTKTIILVGSLDSNFTSATVAMTWQDDIQQLMDAIRELKQEISELKNEVRELKDEVGELKDEVGELKHELQSSAASSSTALAVLGHQGQGSGAEKVAQHNLRTEMKKKATCFNFFFGFSSIYAFFGLKHVTRCKHFKK